MRLIAGRSDREINANVQGTTRRPNSCSPASHGNNSALFGEISRNLGFITSRINAHLLGGSSQTKNRSPTGSRGPPPGIHLTLQKPSSRAVALPSSPVKNARSAPKVSISPPSILSTALDNHARTPVPAVPAVYAAAPPDTPPHMTLVPFAYRAGALHRSLNPSSYYITEEGVEVWTCGGTETDL